MEIKVGTKDEIILINKVVQIAGIWTKINLIISSKIASFIIKIKLDKIMKMNKKRF